MKKTIISVALVLFCSVPALCCPCENPTTCIEIDFCCKEKGICVPPCYCDIAALGCEHKIRCHGYSCLGCNVPQECWYLCEECNGKIGAANPASAATQQTPDYSRAANVYPITLEPQPAKKAAEVAPAAQIAQITTQINSNPKNEILYTQRAALYSKEGEIDKALADYKTAKELNPKDTKVGRFIGRIEFSKGRWNEAVQAYSYFMTGKDPITQDAYYRMGIAYQNLGKHGEAILSFKRGLDVKDKAMEVPFLLERGYSNLVLKNCVKAKEDILGAMAKEPNYVRSGLYGAAVYWICDKNKAKALDNMKAGTKDIVGMPTPNLEDGSDKFGRFLKDLAKTPEGRAIIASAKK
ncbi:MAG: tetratricopeptide repeat protein [Elusimicrobia bacterium]|nr:tetratricopeptide repeat protein [Elusimicrobiota bacterium]